MYIRPITLPALRALQVAVRVSNVWLCRKSEYRMSRSSGFASFDLNYAVRVVRLTISQRPQPHPHPDTRPLADLGDAVPVAELMAICRVVEVAPTRFRRRHESRIDELPHFVDGAHAIAFELFPSYRRKSFIVKLELRTKFLFGCTNYRDFRRFFSPPKKPKNAGCFGKNAGMRENHQICGISRTIAGWLTPMLHVSI